MQYITEVLFDAASSQFGPETINYVENLSTFSLHIQTYAAFMTTKIARMNQPTFEFHRQ